MKISKDRLKELVQEELAISFGGVAPIGGMEPAAQAKPNSDGEGYMAKQNLWKIGEYANEMYDLLQDDDCLEPWVEEKLAVAAYIMDSVGHYIEYMKHRQGEMSGDSMMPPLEQGGMEEPEMEMGPEEDDEEFEFDMSDEDDAEDSRVDDMDSDEYEEEEYEDEEGEV